MDDRYTHNYHVCTHVHVHTIHVHTRTHTYLEQDWLVGLARVHLAELVLQEALDDGRELAGDGLRDEGPAVHQEGGHLQLPPAAGGVEERVLPVCLEGVLPSDGAVYVVPGLLHQVLHHGEVARGAGCEDEGRVVEDVEVGAPVHQVAEDVQVPLHAGDVHRTEASLDPPVVRSVIDQQLNQVNVSRLCGGMDGRSDVGAHVDVDGGFQQGGNDVIVPVLGCHVDRLLSNLVAFLGAVVRRSNEVGRMLLSS